MKLLLLGTLFAGMLVQGASEFREGTVLVGFRATATEAAKAAVYRKIRAVEVQQTRTGLHVLRVAAGTELGAMHALRANAMVRFAELDIPHKATAGVIPSDPSFNQQWGLLNTGQAVNGFTGVAGNDIKATTAWSMTTGSPAIVVALLDTGIQYTHPDLQSNVWSNPGIVTTCPQGTHGFNVLNGTCDPFDDENFWGGHGTFMAGVIGASGNSGAGVSGVNWTTSIMTVKWLDSQDQGFTSDLVTAMNWVVAAKQAGVNVRVVNNSFTSTTFSQAESDAIDALAANDILLVASSGNSPLPVNLDITPKYPCSYKRPNTVCATGSETNNTLWSASNYGASTVDVAAPAASIYSTLRQNNYGFISGTSMSTAYVSGEAALILSRTNMSTIALRAAIVNNVNTNPTLIGKTITGGVVDLCKAIAGCANAATAPPVNLTPPEIGGFIRIGSLVSASTGTWSGAPTNFSYQWTL